VFSAALAVGALFTQGESLIEALFGRPGALGVTESIFGFVGSIGVAVIIISQRHRLVVALVSRDLAQTSGIDVPRLSLLYLVTFSVTVALGLRYLGVLLMGSLIIIPAAAAKHLAANLNSMLAIAVALVILSTLAGTLLAHALPRETGPVIIAIAAAVFFPSLLERRG
jgi:ABC-type Mn2+/Zn2+ transport system permease subunit